MGLSGGSDTPTPGAHRHSSIRNSTGWCSQPWWTGGLVDGPAQAAAAALEARISQRRPQRPGIGTLFCVELQQPRLQGARLRKGGHPPPPRCNLRLGLCALVPPPPRRERPSACARSILSPGCGEPWCGGDDEGMGMGTACRPPNAIGPSA